MSTEKSTDKEVKYILNKELKKYMETVKDLTADEKKKLRKWVSSGHSVYDNPYDMCDERGEAMDYIKAIRLCEEDFWDDFEIYQNYHFSVKKGY
jgi:hypothetical protein